MSAVVWCVRFNLGQETRVDGVRLYIGRLPSTPHRVKVYYFDRYSPTKLTNSLFSASLLLVAATLSLFLVVVVRRLEVNAVLQRLLCDVQLRFESHLNTSYHLILCEAIIRQF